ncbi:transposase [Clostridium sp. MSJ-4]|uniref:Transposase n=1 Tax=Clostridium simiarum TaxID=2841506 RepID=A0ABS6F0G9_9CLOT|nr:MULTISPECIES: transposase [Clostridium]MBU5591989.1 transposase [Clostridium simiarum]
MPRGARIKKQDGIYHIILRSISEIQLFKIDEDKDQFLKYLKKYKIQFGFRLYAYCIMSNHVHLIIDSNGADISRIMHGINQSYAQYYNRKYSRYGHLFQDRFKSKIVESERYFIALSLYIHNNPKDIVKYRNNIEKYRYSSLGIYLGFRKDEEGILDRRMLINLLSGNYKKFKTKYKIMLNMNVSEEEFEKYDFKLEKNYYKYKSDRIVISRNNSHLLILDILLQKFNVKKDVLFLKNNTYICEFKSIFVLLCRNLCNMTYKELGKILINNSQPNLSKLCSKGINLVMKNVKYKNIVDTVYKELCLG